jgi:hypothetical protein
MMRNFASQIARREVGIHWIDRFIHRYPDKLISRWTTGIDNSHHKADSGRKYRLYFDLLREKIDQYQAEARHIYNMDKKGFLLGILGRSKRIFNRPLYEEGKRRSTIQDGSVRRRTFGLSGGTVTGCSTSFGASAMAHTLCTSLWGR